MGELDNNYISPVEPSEITGPEAETDHSFIDRMTERVNNVSMCLCKSESLMVGTGLSLLSTGASFATDRVPLDAKIFFSVSTAVGFIAFRTASEIVVRNLRDKK